MAWAGWVRIGSGLTCAGQQGSVDVVVDLQSGKKVELVRNGHRRVLVDGNRCGAVQSEVRGSQAIEHDRRTSGWYWFVIVDGEDVYCCR